MNTVQYTKLNVKQRGVILVTQHVMLR
jgi:hypothetical protein